MSKGNMEGYQSHMPRLTLTCEFGLTNTQNDEPLHPPNNRSVPTPGSAPLHNQTSPFLVLCQKLTFCIYISAFRMEIVI